ncbi:hypothetical protein Tco_0104569 [Tanacetum coccineum]
MVDSKLQETVRGVYGDKKAIGEIDIFDFETPLYKEFKDFNHLLQIDVDALTRDLLGFKTYADYKMRSSINRTMKCHGLKKNHENFGNYHELDYELMMKLEEYWWGKKDDEEPSEDAWSNNLPNDDNDAIQANQERFDDHEPMEGDDDDIGDLDDYLIPQDAFYYVDEEEERFKERKSKLLGIPYEKPPTFKFEKLEDSIRRDAIAMIFFCINREVLILNEESGGV